MVQWYPVLSIKSHIYNKNRHGFSLKELIFKLKMSHILEIIT